MAWRQVILLLLSCELLGVHSFWNSFAQNMASWSTRSSGGGGGGGGVANSGKLLNKDLLTKPNSDVILTVNQPMAPIISSFASMTFANRDEHASKMVAAMQTASLTSQAPILATLNVFNAPFEAYWLTNQIFVKNANPPLIQALMAIGAVKSIAEDQKFPIVMPIVNSTLGTRPEGILWNVKKVKAHKLWKKGIKGKGIIIAGIDTGVRGTHETLRDNFLGSDNFGWFDPIYHTKEPSDVQGHGTHTMGTMVGRYGIGAAPKAKWMACIGCGLHSCMQHALLACGQYILCPNDHKKKNKANCTHVPHIVNNSWGGPGGQTWYDEVIEAWKAAGIHAFFANGNSGPACETAGSPGDNDYVMSVGATDKDDKLAKFSSRGPKVMMTGGVGDDKGPLGELINAVAKVKTATDSIKPEISAPGHEINSAGFLADNGYKVLSGTSMASPLVAGTAALLLSKNPKLSMEEMKELMYSTAEQQLPYSGYQQCGDVVETEFPNNMYGHGRLNVYKAYQKMVKRMKKKKERKEKKKLKKLMKLTEDNEEDDKKEEEEGQDEITTVTVKNDEDESEETTTVNQEEKVKSSGSKEEDE